MQQSLFDDIPSHAREAASERPRPALDSATPLRFVVLGSGSGGNAVVVESGGHRLLIDAGFSCRELERRMALVGIAPSSIGAVVLTHEHEDHVRGVDRFARRHRISVFATEGTVEGCTLTAEAAARIQTVSAGAMLEVPGFLVETFLIPHDAREPVGLVVEDEAGRRVGLAADLGSCSRLAWGRLVELDAMILETNHNLDMLRNGPYPWSLKQRVAGRHGHLSNAAAADGVAELLADRLRTVVLYHLSQTNNLPALAEAVIGERLACEGSSANVVVTSQDQPSAWLEIRPH